MALRALCNNLSRSGSATFAKSVRGGVLPLLSPKAPAASARSGLAAEIGLADVLPTMPRVLPKISLSDLKPAMPQLLAKAPAAGHSLPKAPSGASRSTAWVSRPHDLRDAFTKGAAEITRGMSTSAKIPRQGKASANIRLRTAVAVWSVAAANFYTEIDIDTIFEPKEIDEPVEQGIPESLDWSELGFLPNIPRVISFIYNHQYCGCCWAIAAVKSVEWAYAIKYGKVFPLSVQQLIDCGEKLGDRGEYQGCAGGFVQLAFPYMVEAGLTSEEAYPCSSFQGRCRLAGKPIAVRIGGFETIVPTEESFILALQSGPIAVRLYANEYFALFGGGRIIELERCPSQGGTLHCVVLVGYGEDEEGRKYWKIQNTLGMIWGERGYARLRRGVSDPLGVAGMFRFHGYRPTGVQDTQKSDSGGVQGTQKSDSD